jgi:CRISPR-associated protein Cmr6
MQALRSTLKELKAVSRSTHIGLWLDKFLPEQEEKNGSAPKKADNPRFVHYKSLAGLAVPDIYQDFFRRWEQFLKAVGAKTARAEVKNRMVVGLGAESVLETAITLHRTYGVPYIPGSALKGLAAAYARKYMGADWEPNSEDYHYRLVFGDKNSAGFVVFFDAFYVPGSAPKDKPLALDVISVHHPDYYRGGAVPADWDSPTPISFVTAQGRYLLALCGPDDWVKVALKVLALALENEGVGAKTSSGYGRLSVCLKEWDGEKK